jgi:hypothetical protein
VHCKILGFSRQSHILHLRCDSLLSLVSHTISPLAKFLSCPLDMPVRMGTTIDPSGLITPFHIDILHFGLVCKKLRQHCIMHQPPLHPSNAVAPPVRPLVDQSDLLDDGPVFCAVHLTSVLGLDLRVSANLNNPNSATCTQ